MSGYDAIVLGGGPAGAATALGLARAGMRVAVVEKAAFPRRKVCGEYISAGSWPLLCALAGDALMARAGPPVRRVGLFAGDAMVSAPMPAGCGAQPWGRALGREHLDGALLEAAGRAGTSVWQPWNAEGVADAHGEWRVQVRERRGAARELRARVLVAAHGSWEHGSLPTQPPRGAARAADLLGFKAHFEGARLAAGLMPLLLFPGGYGGLVESDAGRTSFSCCIRRDALRRVREAHRGLAAGDAVLLHAMESCRGVREALGGARRAGPWLSAGPMRTGLRTLARGRMFVAGNAAAEAHPLVAEGISMAIQSGWLLAGELARAPGLGDAALARAGGAYARAWRRHFALRLRAASAFAALTTSRATAGAAVALLRAAPALLTLGAGFSGKARAPRLLEARP